MTTRASPSGGSAQHCRLATTTRRVNMSVFITNVRSVRLACVSVTPQRFLLKEDTTYLPMGKIGSNPKTQNQPSRQNDSNLSHFPESLNATIFGLTAVVAAGFSLGRRK